MLGIDSYQTYEMDHKDGIILEELQLTHNSKLVAAVG